MDVVRYGRGLLIAFRQVVGWVSWLLVATQLYDLVLWNVDSSTYFVLPTSFYQWLDDVVRPTTFEASFDLSVWATSMSMVLGLHILVWMALSGWNLARRQSWPVWQRWRRRVFPIVGWGSWLLVSTITLLIMSDGILRERGSKLPSDAISLVVEIVGGLIVVGSLHLAIVSMARRRQS